MDDCLRKALLGPDAGGPLALPFPPPFAPSQGLQTNPQDSPVSFDPARTNPHSEYTAPFAAASEYAHPLETFVLGLGFFFPLVFLLDHLFFWWAWLIVRELQVRCLI